MTMRIVLWNICKGLRNDREEIDETRLTNARLCLEGLLPDVLILNEADYFEEWKGTRTDYQALFNFKFSEGHTYEGHMANCVLSQHPLSNFKTYQNDKRRGGFVVEVDHPDGPLFVATFHPYPNSRPDSKVRDITKTIDLANGKPTVFAADLNAVNPRDNMDEKALKQAFRRIARDKADEAVDKFIIGGVAIFPAIEKLGFRDLVPAEELKHTIPSNRCDMDKSTAMRIDHILGNRSIYGSGWVVEDGQGEWASDHRPVAADVRVELCDADSNS